MNLKPKFTLEELVRGCQNGDRKYQELLYKTMSSKMLGICMRYAKDHFEAKDIMQTGFVKVFKKLHDFRGDGSFEGWVRRIMVHTSIEFYRKNLRTLSVVNIDQTHEQANSENV